MGGIIAKVFRGEQLRPYITVQGRGESESSQSAIMLGV